MNTQFWKDKKVLVTGHSGFKGSWLSFILNSLGAQVTGISKEDLNNNKDLFKITPIPFVPTFNAFGFEKKEEIP